MLTLHVTVLTAIIAGKQCYMNVTVRDNKEFL